MESTSAPIIEFRDLVLTTTDESGHYGPSRIAVARGDTMVIITEGPADARRLLRILATLDRPEGGDYRFKGMLVDLKNYRQCLAVKRQIGYVAGDSAMISNRTLRENLLLTRFYYENDLTIDIDETVGSLLTGAGLIHKLDRRPSDLSGGEMLKAIAIREMAKAPAVMLVERPEDFIQLTHDDGIFRHLMNMVRLGTAVVFYSHNSKMTALANRRLALAGGSMRTYSV